MTTSIHHPREEASNEARNLVARVEPRALRTYTPSQAVLAMSAGIFHWTPEGRRLFDFSSGVLVANLGHNPSLWMKRFVENMGWTESPWTATIRANGQAAPGYFSAPPLSAYNAITSLESEASGRLAGLLQSRPGGKPLEQVLSSASGSAAIQKALRAALARERNRDIIGATRCGFHG